MALECDIIEFPLTQGQNEGTERALLPLGQLSSLQNARFRKTNRLGKRNGYTARTSLDATGAALGNGNGRLTCLGPDFCAVDDAFYSRDETTPAWRLPAKPFLNGALAGTRLAGKFPEFAPASTLEPLQVQSDLTLGGIAGTALPSIGGITYAQGYVWTCCGYYMAQVADWLIRVVVTDPATGLEVAQWDVQAITNTPATVQQQPVLLALGNGTVVLIYDHFTAGVKDGVRVVTCSSVTAGFGAEVAFACLQSAANYCPTSNTEIWFIYGTAALSYTVVRIDPLTMAGPSLTATRATAAAPTLLSVFGNSTGLVWLGFTAVGLFSHAYDATLTFQGAGAQWTIKFANAVGPIMFATRTASSVAAMVTASDGNLDVMDLDSTATQSPRMSQFGCKALSQPFTIGGKIYIWVKHVAGTQLGVATLVRVPLYSEYLNNDVSPYTRSFPVNATLDNRDIDDPVAAGKSGTTLTLPITTALGYAALIYATSDSLVAGVTSLLRRFVIVPVRHRSEGIRYANSCVLPASGKQFVAGAQPHWVDGRGCYEAGFIQAPVSTLAAIVTAGGALTINSDYSYTAYFECIDPLGQYERSAIAVPVKAKTTANTTVTVHFSLMQLGSRQQVRCKIFRTAANGSEFFLVGSVDATPASSATTDFTFVDVYADTDIIQNGPVYTQIGQELDAVQFPACSFAASGNGRLLCAGGFNGHVGTFSKPFTARICPEFADDDAFRVTLPADWTGAAYCDNWVGFTQEGIYIISGDGPDQAGQGFFSPASRLPFNLGCIDWRSVAVSDLGVWFQSARGLYLLPRGFGTPIAMDQVLDTLTTYPIITSARVDYSSAGGADNSEQIIQWTAVADEAATSGVVITYDCAYKAFSVDTYNADYPATFNAGWLGDGVLAPATMTVGPRGAAYWHPFRERDDGYDDQGLTIDMRGVTGDLRPWGQFGHGVINRVGLLGELRSACELELRKTTDVGESHWSSRVYDGVDPAIGSSIYLEAPLGDAEQRDVTALRISFHEDSATEGAAIFGLYVEHQDNNQGWHLSPETNRINVRPDALLTEDGADVITTEDGEQLVTEDGS